MFLQHKYLKSLMLLLLPPFAAPFAALLKFCCLSEDRWSFCSLFFAKIAQAHFNMCILHLQLCLYVYGHSPAGRGTSASVSRVCHLLPHGYGLFYMLSLSPMWPQGAWLLVALSADPIPKPVVELCCSSRITVTTGSWSILSTCFPLFVWHKKRWLPCTNVLIFEDSYVF